MLKANYAKVRTAETKSDDRIVGYIYETTNPAQFEMFGDNRKINDNHVKKIKAGILDGKTNRLETLLIVKMNDGRKIVADGNHRVKAATELANEGTQVKLRYQVMDENEILKQDPSVAEFVQFINNDRKAWPLEDMVRLFAKSDADPERKQSYLILVSLHDNGNYFPDTNNNWRYIACILANGKAQASALKLGTFRTSMSRAQFEHYYNKIEKIANALGLKLKNNFVEAIINAWFSVKESVDYDRFIDEHGFNGFLEGLKKITPDSKVSDVEYWKGVFNSVIK